MNQKQKQFVYVSPKWITIDNLFAYLQFIFQAMDRIICFTRNNGFVYLTKKNYNDNTNGKSGIGTIIPIPIS